MNFDLRVIFRDKSEINPNLLLMEFQKKEAVQTNNLSNVENLYLVMTHTFRNRLRPNYEHYRSLF